MSKSPDIRYAHPNHEAFNDYLEKRGKPASKNHVASHWMKPGVMEQLPLIQNEFDNSRDPLVREQKADLRMSEAERRRANLKRSDNALKSKRPSEMIKRDKPQPVLKPGPKLARGADAANYNRRWSDETRGARQAASNLVQERTNAKDLAIRNERHAAAPNEATMRNLEMEFYMLERRARHVIGESQKQRRNLQQKIT